MTPKPDPIEDPKIRAEDIILGALGFGEDARIATIQRTDKGFVGTGVFTDGEVFEFESDEDLDELEEWALKVLIEHK